MESLVFNHILTSIILVTIVVIGFFALFRNKRNKTNLIFSLFIFSTAFWIFSNLMVDLAETEASLLLWSKLTIVGVIFLAIFFWKFSLNFPRSKKYKIVYEILIWIAALILLLFVPTRYNIMEVKLVPGGVPLVKTGELYIGLLAYIAIIFFSGFINLIKSYRASVGISKRQVTYVIIGVILSATGSIITNLILVILGFSGFANLGPLFVLIFIVLTIRAIVRYRFLDVRLIILRTISFGTIVLFITTIFVTLSITVGDTLQGVLGVRSDMLVGLTMALFITVTYQPVRRFIGRITNKFLYKKSYNPDKLLAQISETTSSILNFEQLLTEISKTLIDAFHCEKIGIVLLAKDNKLDIAFKEGFVDTTAERLVSYPNVLKILDQELKQVHGILVIDEMKTRYENGEFRPINPELLQALYDNGIALIVPLSSKDKLIGIIAVGNKKSGDPYSQPDLNTLDIVAGQAAVAIENAQLYDELKDFNFTLQKKVDDATKELREANVQLRELDQTKSEFISIASHQLRTPLTVIKGYISMMQEGSFGKVPPKILEHLSKVFIANERLIALVENLLDISRIESGRQEFNWEKVDLEELANTVVEELHKNAEDRGLKLRLHKSKTKVPAVFADRNKLHEVMMNFVDNSIKYTEKGHIDVYVTPEPAGMVDFSVKDTGRGVDEDTINHLFQKFQRGTGSFKVHTEGTGLGLYVARMIVNNHKGVLGVESAGKDKGAHFFFRLPVGGPKSKNYQPQEPIARYLGK
ncbi:MAG: ATP-binding protein [Candidatus Shapirobacteria bacterium]